MNLRASLRSKLIIGFLAVTVPLFILLMYNNLYAMDVVRAQVGQSNKNLLAMYMNEIDRTLEDTESYVYNFVVQNSDLSVYGKAKTGSADYFFSKVRLQNKMMSDIIRYPNVNMFFVYSRSDRELLSTSFRGGDFAKMESVSKALKNFISEQNDSTLSEKKWKVLQRGGELAMVRLIKTDNDQLVGVWMDVDKLMIPLNYLNLGDQGQALFVSNQGKPLTKTTIRELQAPSYTLSLPAATELYRTLRTIQEKKYLIVATASRKASIHLAVLVPESTLLQQLPYFQRLLYVIPLIGMVVLAIYLLLLQRTLLKPMYYLIKGMRRIKRGELETRLAGASSKEFMIINDTFNDMVAQIHDLKIDVYEEHIRTQKAELKHLQVQINPHFLLNAINIIYNLAELNKTDLIKKMSKHITKYFRFVTRTNLNAVSVSKELEHIESYLEIQQLRFPNYLRYEISLDTELANEAIPPLIIQPFVENAVIHGFVMGKEPFVIQVMVIRPTQLDAPYYEVHIADNGVGMGHEQLEELQRNDLNADFEDGHLGIWNVRHRLKLQYGTASELTFEQRVPKGTLVIMRIPRSKTYVIEGGQSSHVQDIASR
ncbi:hypothetical protein Back11_26500 [Paenibacillus baekrokdamisoli]|uniref:Uncharacterized protein n=1 Tax=Paenibacillus baekrokdamisoli TaxID=1712516 RepID=A0A3G9IYR3_9BACL|nr:sensor histidine kinase [Paenibacillus baekrokdamisoli]MBB3070300.1 two-component system sensor histidine kinase YesM [Paenibacillus baekrokdamisoli]BBH21305.1 hypothetical protein Back11_26500 [Paenibacillus baekrokdamisoli]